MIYTCTFNPAIDLVLPVPNLALGDLNRVTNEAFVPGGKGINASIIFSRLDLANVATGFLGGFTAQYLEAALIAEAVTPHFITVEGTTRINVKLKGEVETEINASGPTVCEAQFKQLVDYLATVLQADDVLFLAGTAAPGLDEAAYVSLAKLCQTKQVNLVLDTTKAFLTKCLAYRPFIIKPNHHELGEIFDVEINDQATLIKYARKLQQLGARNVLVSQGGAGATLVTETQAVYRSNIPTGTLVNSVGAGDSMLAGFIATYIKTKDYAQALKVGAATGSATAYQVGLATKVEIEKLLPQIIITKIEE
ncbi:MAG: 1-phosphofructokinase [Culicoidibacterales bacterium]